MGCFGGQVLRLDASFRGVSPIARWPWPIARNAQFCICVSILHILPFSRCTQLSIATAVAMQPYPYLVSNSELIRRHGLEPHFEGGYFKQTLALASSSPEHASDTRPKIPGIDSPRVQTASGSAAELLATSDMTDGIRSGAKATNVMGTEASNVNEATCIYYLITPESCRGRMHMNDYSVSS